MIGRPTRPDLTWDPDFPGEHDDSPTLGDRASWVMWAGILQAGHAHPDLDDATALYQHYRGASGTPLRVDYEEGYNEDELIRVAVDHQVLSAQEHADRLANASGLTSFSITGDAIAADDIVPGDGYPTATGNWQKTLGGYQVWTSGDIEIDGEEVTMTVTVNAEDRYNFNDGDADIQTGLPDDDNVRFAQLGWTRGFNVSGAATRTVTWKLGEPPGTPNATASGAPERNPGREDRADERRSGDPTIVSRPGSDPETGERRGR